MLDAGIVTGRHGVEAEPDRAVEKPAKLEMPVALDARVRRETTGMSLGVRPDDTLLEFFREVEHVVIDPETRRDATRVLDVTDRAAP